MGAEAPEDGAARLPNSLHSIGPPGRGHHRGYGDLILPQAWNCAWCKRQRLGAALVPRGGIKGPRLKDAPCWGIALQHVLRSPGGRGAVSGRAPLAGVSKLGGGGGPGNNQLSGGGRMGFSPLTHSGRPSSSGDASLPACRFPFTDQSKKTIRRAQTTFQVLKPSIYHQDCH